MIFALLMLVASPSPTAAVDTACITMNTRDVPLATRKSPLDSVSFHVGSSDAKVCYGRPSLRKRTVIGGAVVPYGKLWRTGANEPTMLHTTGPIRVGSLDVPAGSYSLYTIPAPSEWTLIVNRSTSQWGEEHGYTKEIERQELGRTKVKAAATGAPIETFTIRSEPDGSAATALVMEWDRARVRVPLASARER